MRTVIQPQLKFGETDIAAIAINPKSREFRTWPAEASAGLAIIDLESTGINVIAQMHCPNFRVLSDFRKDHGVFFQDCFKQTVKLAMELKLASLGISVWTVPNSRQTPPGIRRSIMVA